MFKISEEDKNAINVLDLSYMRMLRFILKFLNAWPASIIGEPRNIFLEVFLYCLQIPTVLSFIPKFLYVWKYARYQALLQSGRNYINIFVAAVYWSRVILTRFQRYKDICAHFLLKVHLFHVKNNSDYAMKIHIKVHKMSYICTIYWICLVLIGSSLYNLTPMISNYMSGMYSSHPANFTPLYELPIYYSVPFNYENDLRGYIYVNIFSWFISAVVTYEIFMTDLLLTIMVFHIWGHYKILINILETFPRPIATSNVISGGFCSHTEMYKAGELPEVHKRLVECINYQRRITNFVSDMSSVFGPILLVYYSYHLVSCCLLLLECSQMTAKAFALYGPLTIGVFQALIMISVTFELIGSMSEKLRDTVYQLPWECMDRSNRKIVLIFMISVQEPVRVKALGLADVGVTTMSKIIKTSFSYFAMLRTFAER